MAAQDAKADKKKPSSRSWPPRRRPRRQGAGRPADAKPAPADIKPPAAPAHPMPTAALAQLIDSQIDPAAPGRQGQAVPPDATDAEFLRRAYLDITGVIPTAEQAAAFLDDRSPDKRAKLIDELLADPNYGRRMADIWTPR